MFSYMDDHNLMHAAHLMMENRTNIKVKLVPLGKALI